MEKSRITAAFFALFGGAVGLHKFYLRDPGGGIFYIILLFMFSRFFPVSMMLGIFDAVRFFSMSDESFDKKYNKNVPHTRGRNRRKVRQSPSQRRRKKDIGMVRDRYEYKETKSKVRDNPFKKSGDKKYKEFELEEAIQDYKSALEISENDSEIHFNMAAVYSLLEKKNESFYHLEQAINLGFQEKSKIGTIDDLAFLRIQEEFDSFKNNGYKRSTQNNIEAPKDDLLQDDVLLSQLNKLKDLRSRGLLSEKEFVYEKEKLLNR